MRPDRIVVGEVRGAEAFELTRAINAGCGFMCTVHANSGPDALNALVNAALMAGENVTEHIVRRVFSQALDLVVHVDRDDAPRGAGRCPAPGHRDHRGRADARRRSRRSSRCSCATALGAPLEWTGALPPGLEARVDRALPRGTRVRDLLAPRGGLGMSVLAALAVGVFCALAAATLMGTMPKRRRSARPGRSRPGATAPTCGCSRPASGSRRRVLGRERVRGLRRAPRRSPRSPARSSSRSCPRSRSGLLPRAYFARKRRAADAGGAGRVARRPARHRRVDRGRPVAHAGGHEPRRDRPARRCRTPSRGSRSSRACSGRARRSSW